MRVIEKMRKQFRGNELRVWKKKMEGNRLKEDKVKQNWLEKFNKFKSLESILINFDENINKINNSKKAKLDYISEKVLKSNF